MSLVYFVSFEGFAVASSMEGSALIFIILTFSAIDLLFLLLKRKRGEFLILLIWFVLVDMRPYPAVRRCPDAKTDFDRKDLFNVAQAIWLNRQISSLATLDTCFPVKTLYA